MAAAGSKHQEPWETWTPCSSFFYSLYLLPCFITCWPRLSLLSCSVFQVLPVMTSFDIFWWKALYENSITLIFSSSFPSLRTYGDFDHFCKLLRYFNRNNLRVTELTEEGYRSFFADISLPLLTHSKFLSACTKCFIGLSLGFGDHTASMTFCFCLDETTYISVTDLHGATCSFLNSVLQWRNVE